MAEITLNIPDAELPRVRTALCAVSNLPESNANARQTLVTYIKDIVRSYEYNLALAAQTPPPPPIVDGVVT